MQEKRKQWKSKDYIQANARLRVGKKCVILLMSFIMLLLLSSCGGKGCAQNLGAGVDDFAVGLMFSAEAGGEVTELSFLDDDWNPEAEYFLKYADFADAKHPPITDGNGLYATPAGEMHARDTQVTVFFDWKKGRLLEYDNGENMSGPSDFVMNDYGIYICANSNGYSYVQYRNKKKMSQTLIKKFENEDGLCVMDLAVNEEIVLCTGCGYEEEISWIYLLDAKTLETIDKIRIPATSLNQAIICGEYAYVECLIQNSKYGIVQIDLTSGKWKRLDLPIRYRPGGFVQYEDQLYIADSNWMDESGECQWICYHLKSGRLKTFEADDAMSQIAISQGQLYALGVRVDERGTLYRYNIEGGRLVLDRKLKIKEDIFSAPVDCFFLPNP